MARNQFAVDHDACGVGFVTRLGHRGSHEIVERALEVLRRLAHRGWRRPPHANSGFLHTKAGATEWDRSAVGIWPGDGVLAGREWECGAGHNSINCTRERPSRFGPAIGLVRS